MFKFRSIYSYSEPFRFRSYSNSDPDSNSDLFVAQICCSCILVAHICCSDCVLILFAQICYSVFIVICCSYLLFVACSN
jgi:hypothetical protein